MRTPRIPTSLGDWEDEMKSWINGLGVASATCNGFYQQILAHLVAWLNQKSIPQGQLLQLSFYCNQSINHQSKIQSAVSPPVSITFDISSKSHFYSNVQPNSHTFLEASPDHYGLRNVFLMWDLLSSTLQLITSLVRTILFSHEDHVPSASF